MAKGERVKGKGMNPNSQKNLKRGNPKTQFTVKNAVEMQKRSTEAKLKNKSIKEDMLEQLTPEVIKEMNARMILMAKHGNINAWKEIRDTIGEKPTDKVEVSGSLNIADMLRKAQERENMEIDDAEAVDGDLA